MLPEFVGANGGKSSASPAFMRICRALTLFPGNVSPDCRIETPFWESKLVENEKSANAVQALLFVLEKSIDPRPGFFLRMCSQDAD
jgi:hypothetical protein